MIKVYVPTVFASYTNGVSEFTIAPCMIRDLSDQIKEKMPQLYAIMYQEKTLKNFICLYINSTLIQNHEFNISVAEGDSIRFMIAMVGG